MYLIQVNNMKKYILIIVFLVTTGTAFAIFSSKFRNWQHLTEYSPDIVIARCVLTPDFIPSGTVPNQIVVTVDGVIESDIEAIMVLKGDTKPGLSHLASWYSPRQGEYYLIFASRNNKGYQAIENYRVVPLGLNFNTNSLSGKSLNEQLQFLFKLRLDDLNQQMKEEQEEKQRLEEGIKK